MSELEIVSLDPVISTINVGDKIAGYTILKKLGEGGMGVVFHAHDPNTGHEVAIKFLSAAAAYTPEISARFVREAAMYNKVKHSGVVKVHRLDTHNGRPFIVMEFLNGQSLGDVVRESRLPLGRACYILLQIADAMQAVHDQSIVHRDLKPDNVFLLAGDTVKIIDLGIAKALQEVAPDSPLRTKTGHIIGTPVSMSPEQIMGAREIDYRSDIYALGTIAYFLLAGHWPHEGDQNKIIYEHLHVAPVPLRQVNAWVSEEIAAVVHKAMAKKPSDRFQTMLEFAEALVPWADATVPVPSQLPTVRAAVSKPITTLSSSSGELRQPTYAQSNPPSAGPRQASWLALGAGVGVLMALVGTGAYFVSKRSRATSPPPSAPVVTASSLPTESKPTQPALVGRVLVSTVPTGATAVVNGRPRGQTPVLVSGSVGATLQVHLSMEGYEERLVPVLIISEEDRKAEFVLTPSRPASTTAKPTHSSRSSDGRKTTSKKTSGDNDYMGDPFSK